ncbi:unnamed protein product [Nippostrongylus brasiliensis]|uniref:Uncharacterized protein n=1 Tax=Nippostrongylus brasiliensis TaxID=27835 RepID=A0A0N4YX86_NIPBR|nr:unnamed protein product [Nippostrongylus brasiliensis]
MSSKDEYDEIQSPQLSLHGDDPQSPSPSSEPASRGDVDIEYPDSQPQQLRDQVERLACHLMLLPMI